MVLPSRVLPLLLALVVVLGACRSDEAERRPSESSRRQRPDGAEVDVVAEPAADADAVGSAADGAPVDAEAAMDAEGMEADGGARRWPATLPAAVAEVVGRRLIIIELGGERIGAVDMVTGRQRWAAELPSPGDGAVEIGQLGGGRLLVHGGAHLTVLELADGRRVATRRGPYNHREERVYLWRSGSLCGLRTSCSMQLIDCGDASLIGRPLQGRVTRRFPDDSATHHTGCWGFSPVLLGRYGDLAIAVGDHDPSRPGAPEAGSSRAMTVAIDVDSGRDRWSSTEATCEHCRDEASGLSPDASTCWLTDGQGRLTIFACQTGGVRVSLDLEARLTAWIGGATPGLFVASLGRASLLNPLTGRPRWTEELGPGTLAVVAGARIPAEGVYLPRITRRLVLLDADSGRELGAIDLRQGDRLLPVEGGGLRVASSGQGWDRRGRALPADRVEPPMFEVEREGTPHNETSRAPRGSAVVRCRGSDQQEVRLDADAWSLGEHQEGGFAYAAVFVTRGAQSGEVRIFRAPLEAEEQAEEEAEVSEAGP